MSDDLISRQQAIDTLCHVDESNTQSIIAIIKLPSAAPEQKWTPCSERLPEKDIDQWLCCTSGGDVMILSYGIPEGGLTKCFFYKWDDNGYFYQTYDVVAWMPKPKPWEGKIMEKGEKNDQT